MSIAANFAEIVELYPRALSVALDLVIPSNDLDLTQVLLPTSHWANLYTAFKNEYGEPDTSRRSKGDGDVHQRLQVLLGIGHQWSVPAFFWSNPQLFHKAARSMATIVVKFLIFKHRQVFSNIPKAVLVVYKVILTHTAEVRGKLADVGSKSRRREADTQRTVFTGWMGRGRDPELGMHPRAAFWNPAWHELAVCETGYLPRPTGASEMPLALAVGERPPDNYAQIKATILAWDIKLQVALYRLSPSGQATRALVEKEMREKQRVE